MLGFFVIFFGRLVFFGLEDGFEEAFAAGFGVAGGGGADGADEVHCFLKKLIKNFIFFSRFLVQVFR